VRRPGIVLLSLAASLAGALSYGQLMLLVPTLCALSTDRKTPSGRGGFDGESIENWALEHEALLTFSALSKVEPQSSLQNAWRCRADCVAECRAANVAID
jgi:hypothetical protein